MTPNNLQQRKCLDGLSGAEMRRLASTAFISFAKSCRGPSEALALQRLRSTQKKLKPGTSSELGSDFVFIRNRSTPASNHIDVFRSSESFTPTEHTTQETPIHHTSKADHRQVEGAEPAPDTEPRSIPAKHKTVAESDAELRAKMEGRAGDGGEAGLELEDGQPVSMKRGVKNNMFRYI